MLGYKDGQGIQPSYNYYLETDLDNVDDQLVDYSKRYADQDSDDVCCSTSGKKRHHSPSIANSVTKQSYDEVKVYCMEGTPLMISSASSLCDLREVDITEQVPEVIISKTGKKHCFSQSPRCSTVDQEISENKSIEIVSSSELLSVQCEKEESRKEDEENTAQEVKANLTKSSSPLMFSRTSSIGSLSSFEQHSIVDDRSSVSAFSTLNSGIISPSEIPDSPGEAMSPFIHKNKHSEFQFPSSEKSMDPILDKLKNNSTEQFMDEAFEDLSEDDIKVFNDEGDCFSVSNLSALSIQADSTHLSISFIQHKSEFLEIIDKPSVDVNCGVTSLNASFVEKCNNEQLNTSDEINEQDYNFSEIINVSTTKCSQNENLKDHDSYNLASDGITCERKGISDKGINSYQNTSSAADDTAFKEISVDVYLQESEAADYSKDISDDDECDPLIEECILSGMPKKPSSNHDLSRELSHNYQSNGVSVSKEITTQPHCSYSDNDASDDENIEIIDECIQLGMPQKSSSPHMQDKIVSGPTLEESLNKKYVNVSSRMSSTSNPMDKFRNCDIVSSQDVDPKELNKSDEESDIDESELLVQQCIQLGMPKSQLRNSKNMKATRKAYAFTKELGYRDNCPDGISDVEDDDDIVSECIKAGMPSSKSQANESHYSAQTKNLRHRPQNQRKLTAAEDRAQYLRKDCYGNLQDDSMCIYRTEDTPILSPTASLSDLSTLSFADDKICQESFLNNSRNSDCSSESEDDELLLQCIRSGMPGAKRVIV